MEKVLRCWRLIRVDLSEVRERVGTGSEELGPLDIVGEGLHYDCFESRDGLFAESCGYRMREGERV